MTRLFFGAALVVALARASVSHAQAAPGALTPEEELQERAEMDADADRATIFYTSGISAGMVGIGFGLGALGWCAGTHSAACRDGSDLLTGAWGSLIAGGVLGVGLVATGFVFEQRARDRRAWLTERLSLAWSPRLDGGVLVMSGAF